MKRMRQLLSITLLAVLVGCGGGNKLSNDGLITVDVTKSYPKKEMILQDFMDVEYIPLETTDDFITMAHIQAIGKEILIVRNRNRATDGKIFFYSRNGEALRIVNRLGNSGEEYTFLLGITLDENNNEIFVNDHYSKKIFVYDLSGGFKRSFPHKVGVTFDPVYNFDRDNLICHDYMRDFNLEKRNIFWIISKRDGSVIKEIEIPFVDAKSTVLALSDPVSGKRISTASQNQELVPYGGGWLLADPSSDTIYKYLPDHSMLPFIARIPSIQSMTPEIFLFPGVITDRYCFLQSVKKEFDFDMNEGFPRKNLVYDKQEKTIYEYTVYNDDFSDKRNVNLVHEITVLNNEIAFMQKIETEDILECYKNDQLKGKLKEIASKLTEDSNPVIMVVKYKK